MNMTTPAEQTPDMMTTEQLPTEWWAASQALDALKVRELAMRNELFKRQFPNPVEGSAENKVPLGEGWILQADHKINRNVDEAVVSALMKGDNTRPLAEKVFRYKPELVLKAFRDLSDEEKKIVADAVTEKPGTPALKIVLPKR
jgi:hypothetical protein